MSSRITWFSGTPSGDKRMRLWTLRSPSSLVWRARLLPPSLLLSRIGIAPTSSLIPWSSPPKSQLTSIPRAAKIFKMQLWTGLSLNRVQFSVRFCLIKSSTSDKPFYWISNSKPRSGWGIFTRQKTSGDKFSPNSVFGFAASCFFTSYLWENWWDP